MQSVALRLEGPVERQALENPAAPADRSPDLSAAEGPGLAPGQAPTAADPGGWPRLECWFDPKAPTADQGRPGLELVALGLQVDGPSLEGELRQLMGLA
jgi:hypothetical protein